jgi:hypothetical protein
MQLGCLNPLVIASEARQSSGTVALDCRVALLLAMTGMEVA